MKLTLSVIKADIGSIGGHFCPSVQLLDTVRGHVVDHAKGSVIDSYVSHTGGDIAILATHQRGMNDADIHRLAWDAFMVGTATAQGGTF